MFKFERLDVWHRSVSFGSDVIELADTLPQRYQFSLGEQLRRSALSISTNIAEGSGRDNPKEGRYFYTVAKGSVYEVVSLLVMAGKRKCLTSEQYKGFYQQADELAAMITGLIKANPDN